MMKYVPAISLGLSVILGLAAFLLMRSGASEASPSLPAAVRQISEVPPEPAKVKVLLAREEIPAGTPLTSELVMTRDWAPDDVPEGALGRMPELMTPEGAPMFSQVHLAPGELLMVSKVGPERPRRLLSKAIPEGYRAVAVPVTSETSVAGFVLPGERVDINAFIPVPGKTGPEAFTARPLLQNVLVLAVDQQMGQHVEGAWPSSLVTLALLPADAQKVTAASRESRLGLALIGLAELEKREAEGEVAPPPPPRPIRRVVAPRPPATASVTVVHGTSAHSVTTPVEPSQPMLIGDGS